MYDSDPPPEETRLQPMFETPMRASPRVEWIDLRGHHVVEVKGRVLVGSSPDSGLVVNDPAVSRLHAELEPRQGGLWIRDLDSRNGTFIEGVQVASARVPAHGKIRLGSTELTVDSTSSEAQPVDLWPHDSFGKLVGGSAAMRELFAALARIAPMDVSVLIGGETGTGKELVARAIHDASPRASGPFVVVDCAALPESLLDTELFGHTKGAFTGAATARAGAIESAEGGTVFLDEVGELPLSVQPKLLRVLEQHTVRRVGESNYRHVDVRVVSATHRDLLKMVNAGEFREDLYFRLCVVPIEVPPLRDRKEDIEQLVNHFLKLAGDEGRFGPDLVRELVERPWRGNVRELRNFVERARALGADEALAITRAGGSPLTRVRSSLGPSTPTPMRPLSLDPRSLESSADGGSDEELFSRTYRDFREGWIEAGEKRYVARLLARHGRNVASAAREAEVDRTHIYRLIRKHDL